MLSLRKGLGFVPVLIVLMAGCPKPGPDPGQPGTPNKVITCGTQAIQTCAAEAVPAVNDCLAGAGDVTSCLLGLVKPGTCLVYETIACVVRHEGSAAERAASTNPDDRRDARRAARAKEYLQGQAIQFTDGQ